MEFNFLWKPEYEIGNQTIDSEHQFLMETAQKVLNMNCSEDDSVTVGENLAEVFKYIKYHFQHEETFMMYINYPDVLHHKKLHEELSERLRQIITQNSDFDVLLDKIKEFIQNWVIHHILEEDMKLRDYSKNYKEFE